MKKKIIIAVFIIILIVVGLVTSYIDSARVRNGVEPKYTIKIISDNGNKITYWGLGYKVVRYPAVSPKESFKSSLGVKYGSWFMNYKLSNYESIEIELFMEGKTVQVSRTGDIEFIINLLEDSKYINEPCDGINTHKIKVGDEIYYLKESCSELQKGRKQAKISEEDLTHLLKIIDETYGGIYSSNTTEPYIPDGMDIADGNEIRIPANEIEYNREPENVTIEVLENTITKESVEILITDNNEDKYGWGVEFGVQKNLNGEWIDLEYISDDLGWIAIAYLPNEDNQIKEKLNIKKYYGELTKGTYRIVKPIYDNGYIDLYSNEFEIK